VEAKPRFRVAEKGWSQSIWTGIARLPESHITDRWAIQFEGAYNRWYLGTLTTIGNVLFVTSLDGPYTWAVMESVWGATWD